MTLNYAYSPRGGQLNVRTAISDFPGAAACVKRGTGTQANMKFKLNTASAATASSAGIWSILARINTRPSRLALTAPSLRLPATRRNRERLRLLRRAELRAWNAPSPTAELRAEVQRSLTSGHGESWLIGGVTAIATGVLLIGAASTLEFVAHWDRFVSLVKALIG